jgi:transposase
MILVGIDIDKNRHTFSIIDKETGEILANPSVFNNSQEGFLFLIRKLSRQIKASYRHGRYRALSLCLTQISS